MTTSTLIWPIYVRKAPHLALLCIFSVASANGLTPTLISLNPPHRTDSTTASVKVTLSGSDFSNDMQLVFSPAGVIDSSIAAKSLSVADGFTATAIFQLVNPSAATSIVNVTVKAGSEPSPPSIPFYTGVVDSVCLEALQDGGCALLWEVDLSSATGSSSQANNSTTPNILVKLNYQWRSPKNQLQKMMLAHQLLTDNGIQNKLVQNGHNAALSIVNDSRSESATLLKDAKLGQVMGSTRGQPQLVRQPQSDHLVGHVGVIAGYTQAVTAKNVQPTTPSPTSCPSGTAANSPTCTIAAPQQVFLVDGTARFGGTSGVDGVGVFTEFGFSARGSFQYLVPTNQVVTSGGNTYIDLSAANPHNAVGLYEATGYFRLSQLGHDKTMLDGSTGNVTDLIVLQGGYQNNRALQQLTTQRLGTNSRNRYVGRFSINPEITALKHTQLTMGVEYSGGINGGPHVVQLFFGTNLNPAKLFKGGS